MKMAVYHGIRDLRVEEVKEPKRGPKEVKIKIKYCGICGSDLHEYLHGLSRRVLLAMKLAVKSSRSVRRSRGFSPGTA